MSIPFNDPNQTQAYPASAAPTETFQPLTPDPSFTPGPGFAQAQPGPQWYAQPRPGPAAPPAGNGFTAQERAVRSGGNSGHGPVGNWLRTGDSKLNVDSEQGRALKPAIADGWSVAGLICAFFVPIAGLILSMVAFADAKKNQRRVHGTAVGGFFVSIALSLVWTLYWVIVIVAMASLSNAASSYSYGG